MATRTGSNLLSNSEGITIDLRSFADFGVELKNAPLYIRKAMQSKLLAIQEAVIVAAQGKVGPFSSSIPPTIRPGPITGLSVKIYAGSSSEPLAGLFDRGNKGTAGGSTFRHPVFASANSRQRWVWTNQPMHPFMTPAMEATRAENVTAIALAIEEAMQMIADATDG